MLTEQRVDMGRSADIAGRIDGADLDMRAFVGGVYLLQIGAGRGIDLCTGDRIARDAAAEIMDAAGDLLLVALAEEVDERDDQPFAAFRSEEHTSELQSLMRISYAVFCLHKKTTSMYTIHR